MSVNGNGHDADGDSEGKRLAYLALKLDLTDREKAFAEAYAVGPTARNGTASARAAGYRGDDKTLAVTATRALKRAKVQTYLVEMTGAAVAKATAAHARISARMIDNIDDDLARTVKENDQRISDLAESLAYLTTVQRARLGDFLTEEGAPDVARIKAAPAGLVRRYGRKVNRRTIGELTLEDENVQFELESAQQAAKALVEYHTGTKVPQVQQSTVNVLAVLSDLPIETLRQLKGAFERAGGRE